MNDKIEKPIMELKKIMEVEAKKNFDSKEERPF